VLQCDDVHRFLTAHEGVFDLITAADVFIYIGDLTRVFQLVGKRLDQAGIFAFSTERTRMAPYRLRKSGRFAHSSKYICRLAEENDLVVLSTDRIGLRLEHHQWLNGNLFIVGEKSYGKRRLHPLKSWWRQIGRRIFNGGGRAFLRN
jgi:predicted TPR repeat methyltransferase